MKIFGVVLVLSLIFTATLTYPLVFNANTFFTDEADYPGNAFVFWYNYHALQNLTILNHQEYIHGFQLYPYPNTTSYTENLLIPSIFFSAAYQITNSLPFATNFLVLLSFILTLIISFYVILTILQEIFNIPVSRKLFYASFIGAAIFTFNPLTMSHYPNHINLLQKYLLPLIFLFAFKFLQKPRLKYAFLFFLFFMLNLLTNFHLSIFATITIASFATPYIAFNLYRKNVSYFLNLTKGSLIFLIFIPVLLYFYQPFLEFGIKEGVRRSLWDNVPLSARIIDWISPHPNNIIYHEVIPIFDKIRGAELGLFNYSERTLSLNILPLILFIIAILNLYKLKVKAKKISPQHLLFAWGSGFLLFSSFIFSLGPFLLDLYPNVEIKLPFYYLYELTPLLSGERAPSRFQFMFYMPFSLLVAYGAIIVMNKFKYFNFSIFCLFLTLIFLENFVPSNYQSRSQIIEKYNSIKNSIKFIQGENVIHIPVYTYDFKFVKEAGYLNWSMLTEGKTFNGYTSYIPADRNLIAERFNKSFDEKSLNLLNVIGVKYAIIHKNDFLNYNVNSDLYKTGSVFEDNEIQIIDINQYPSAIKRCPSKSNIDYKIQSITEFNYQISITNGENCYVINDYNKRYLRVETELDKQKYMSYLKLPLVIEPYQPIILKSSFRRTLPILDLLIKNSDDNVFNLN